MRKAIKTLNQAMREQLAGVLEIGN
jgi:hypothetical protein